MQLRRGRQFGDNRERAPNGVLVDRAWRRYGAIETIVYPDGSVDGLLEDIVVPPVAPPVDLLGEEPVIEESLAGGVQIEKGRMKSDDQEGEQPVQTPIEITAPAFEEQGVKPVADQTPSPDNLDEEMMALLQPTFHLIAEWAECLNDSDIREIDGVLRELITNIEAIRAQRDGNRAATTQLSGNDSLSGQETIAMLRPTFDIVAEWVNRLGDLAAKEFDRVLTELAAKIEVIKAQRDRSRARTTQRSRNNGLSGANNNLEAQDVALARDMEALKQRGLNDKLRIQDLKTCLEGIMRKFEAHNHRLRSALRRRSASDEKTREIEIDFEIAKRMVEDSLLDFRRMMSDSNFHQAHEYPDQAHRRLNPNQGNSIQEQEEADRKHQETTRINATLVFENDWLRKSKSTLHAAHTEQFQRWFELSKESRLVHESIRKISKLTGFGQFDPRDVADEAIAMTQKILALKMDNHLHAAKPPEVNVEQSQDAPVPPDQTVTNGFEGLNNNIVRIVKNHYTCQGKINEGDRHIFLSIFSGKQTNLESLSNRSRENKQLQVRAFIADKVWQNFFGPKVRVFGFDEKKDEVLAEIEKELTFSEEVPEEDVTEWTACTSSVAHKLEVPGRLFLVHQVARIICQDLTGIHNTKDYSDFRDARTKMEELCESAFELALLLRRTKTRYTWAQSATYSMDEPEIQVIGSLWQLPPRERQKWARTIFGSVIRTTPSSAGEDRVILRKAEIVVRDS